MSDNGDCKLISIVGLRVGLTVETSQLANEFLCSPGRQCVELSLYNFRRS